MPTFGQYDGLIKHWGFDATSRDKDHFHLFGSTSSQIAFSIIINSSSSSIHHHDHHHHHHQFTIIIIIINSS